MSEPNTEQTQTATETQEKGTKRSIKAPPKQVMTDQELKESINHSYSDSNRYFKVVKEAVDNMTLKLRKPILDLIGFADAALELEITEGEDGRKSYRMNFNLTDRELEFLAIKIPTTLLYVQEQINDRALDASIASYIHDDAITERLKTITGGDAKERMRFAEQGAEVEQMVSMIKQQVYQNLKSYVDRADKIYEGVKKVLDGKNKERNLFQKSDRFSA